MAVNANTLWWDVIDVLGCEQRLTEGFITKKVLVTTKTVN